MTAATLRPPEVAGMGRGLTLALVAHGLLILALSYGLNWHSDSSPAFEAELWSSIPQVAAPREETPPEPEPEAPKPDTRAQQRAAEEAAAERQQREAEIAISKDKKRKEEKAREEAAQLEREKAAKEAKDKAAKDKAAKEEQDRSKKEKAAKDAKEAKEAKDADAKREAQRQEFLRRIQGMAGGQPNSDGAAAQNSAPSADWVGRVKAKIRPRIVYAGTGAGNPTVEVQVTLAPDGRILGSKVLKASIDTDWDRGVLNAIDGAETLPRDNGRVPPVIILTFRVRDLP